MAIFRKETASDSITDIWKKYNKGIQYIQGKNLVKRTNENWDFYLGDQWNGLESGEERPVMMNFIHRDVTRVVTTIQSTTMAVNYTNADGSTQHQDIYAKLSSHFSLCWDKADEDVLMRQTVKDAAITGDGLQFFGTSDVADVQRLDNTQVLYGDESETNIQKQPYIIIHQRETVESVRKQAEANKIPPDKMRLILPDDDTENVIGNTDEVENNSMSGTHKVTTLIYMTKINGIVHVARSTKLVEYEPLHAIQSTTPQGEPITGLTLYPIVKFSWEDRPNDARGVSFINVYGQVNNQIEVNKIYERRSMSSKISSYPRPAYIEDLVINADELEKVGKPIALEEGTDASSVNQIISYLQPAQTNDEPRKLSDDIMETTQELSGSGDTTTGNIDLNRVAASAIVAVNEKAESMLDEQKSKAKKAVEDLANLWVEMWLVYNPGGLEVIKEVEVTDDSGIVHKERVPETIGWDVLSQLKPRTRIDVSPDNSFTREACQAFLDSLLSQNKLTLRQYVELVPDTAPVPKQAMLALFDEEEKKAAAMPPVPPEGGDVPPEMPPVQ